MDPYRDNAAVSAFAGRLGEKPTFELIQGNCLDVLKTLPSNSVDAILTDPPYEIGMSGRCANRWDSTGIAYNVALWKEALRVGKPGCYMLSFSSARTYHRMAVAQEDAGWEIRGQLMWIYAGGFPKGLDVSKSIDAKLGLKREVIGEKTSGLQNGDGNSIRFSDGRNANGMIDITAPASDEAKQWNGWNTQLRPSHEPICFARKPLDGGTVVENVLKHSVGALNIDACRFEGGGSDHPLGNHPGDVIHDGSAAFLGELYDQEKVRLARLTGNESKLFYCAKATSEDRDEGLETLARQPSGMFNSGIGEGRDEAGIALRANHHATVKPNALMRYLARLICPRGGTILDIFNGSGSTGKACMHEGINYRGIELQPEYIVISRLRILHAQGNPVLPTDRPIQPTLF